MGAQLGWGTTPHFFWQYVDIISGVHGRGGNMSVLLLEPAGRESSAQTWKDEIKILFWQIETKFSNSSVDKQSFEGASVA